jgi:6-phosphogluconolactonase
VFNILADTTEVKQTISTLPEGFTEKSFCADLHLSASGKSLYGSNRGHNSIVTFKVEADGRLSLPQHQSCGGNWPRNFAVSPSGEYFIVTNQRSDEVSIINTKSGELLSTLKVNAPCCVKFLR